MNVVVEHLARRRVVMIATAGPDHLVGDLALAIASGGGHWADFATATRFEIDGVAQEASTPLGESGLRPGSVVRHAVESPTFHDRGGAALGVLDVVGGLESGQSLTLRPGRYVVGRLRSADLTLESATVSRRHARLDVSAGGDLSITDLGSHNGTAVLGRSARALSVAGEPQPLAWASHVRAGSVTLAAHEPPTDDAPHHLASQPVFGGVGSRPVFNRQPRPPLGGQGPPMHFPQRGRPERYSPRFSWAAIVAPLVLGVAMAVLWDPLFALFILLSPVLTLANWWEERHQHRRERKRLERDFTHDLARFETELQQRLVVEANRRWAQHHHLAEVRRRVVVPSVRLWERRPHHADFLRVSIGRGDAGWTPPTNDEQDQKPEPEVAELLATTSILADVPIELDLSAGTVVGLTGDRHSRTSRAVARSIIAQLVVHHGPADLEIGVLVEPGTAHHWEWASLVPHAIDRHGAGRGGLIGVGEHRIAELANRWVGRSGESVPAVVVVDGESLFAGRDAPVRRLAQAPNVTLVVLAPNADWLPGRTETIVETSSEAGVAVVRTVNGPVSGPVLLDGLASSAAWRIGAASARFDDPELQIAGAGVPASTGLGVLFGEPVTAESIGRRWASSAASGSIATPIGIDAFGTVMLDLIADGPHGLVGGTTGSGKSELLRTMVASLAATADTETVSFLLIDYKGGSAFDGCVGLPHTVGVVTDLDPALSERALRCLEAELEYRERLLRSFAVESIDAYRDRRAVDSGLEPLPRLVVVIDEFATLRTELPDFVDALIGVAQRGRSLGVHLILATQRPSGAVDDNIRTNTNIRIALRVLDAADSIDVIGIDDAAAIGAAQPGRACLRSGPKAVTTFQSARVTGPAPSDADHNLVVVPTWLGEPVEPFDPTQRQADGVTELQGLVEATLEAHAATGHALPRRPWPDPLAADLMLGDVGGHPDSFGLVDDPEQQRQFPLRWEMSDANAVVVGASRSGKTTALRSMVVAATIERSPDELHVYVVDFGKGDLVDLGDLAHVGAVVTAAETERQERLMRRLADEVHDRRATDPALVAARPRILLVVDGLDTMRRRHEDNYALADRFESVFLDGSAVGVHTVVATSSPLGLANLSTAISFQLYLRLSDPSELREIGVRGTVDPEPPPGRGHLGPHGLEAQVAVVDQAGWAIALAHRAQVGPQQVGVLGQAVCLDELFDEWDEDTTGQNRVEGLVVGRSANQLEPVVVAGEVGQHLLVVGPARSGRSNALQVLAASVRRMGARGVWLGDHRDCEHGNSEHCDPEHSDPERIGYGDLHCLASSEWAPTYLFVDDAAGVDDPDGELVRLLSGDAVTVIAAGRTDRLRAAYGHWTNEFRHQRRALVLWPDMLDGDLIGVDIDSSIVRSLADAKFAGRAVLVGDGEQIVVQIATDEA